MIKIKNADKKQRQNYSDDDFPLFPDISEHIAGWSQMHRLMSLFMSLKNKKRIIKRLRSKHLREIASNNGIHCRRLCSFSKRLWPELKPLQSFRQKH